ncbi:MAG: hypothetical protein R3F62_11300 [Planctomycetota bacterium]
MSFPDRWWPPVPDPAEVARFSLLCDRIERRVPGYQEDLAAWNARAARTFEEVEFRTYHGSVDQEAFVTAALLPRPAFDPSVTFDELVAVVRALAEGKDGQLLAEATHSYLLEALELNLPGASVSDLIYWPNAWFGEANADPNDYVLDPSHVGARAS